MSLLARVQHGRIPKPPRVSTPLRMFWGYVNFATGKREADIQPVDDWPSLPLGQAGADDGPAGRRARPPAAPERRWLRSHS